MKYYIINKPYEVLTQFTDEAGRATLKDYVPVPNIYPVGRLDYDSEGMVLLTDDKTLQHRLSDPQFKVEKTYWVQVEGIPSDDALTKLRLGVLVKGTKTSPAKVQLLDDEPEIWERSTPIRFRKNIPTSWVEIKISQGMNRQVRRMTAAVGYPTLRLIRPAIGPLTLGSLQPGEYRELMPEEITQLKGIAEKAPKPVSGRKSATFGNKSKGSGKKPGSKGGFRKQIN
ncbi:23S rRNA pseudouridine2457 synthase [Pontibacter aydingkolensis]|uniref:Pseudouridine synthase n=1 Tax=Pontibacter aydingkolensis TaxID=1911536 RepID=A0ABS7CUV0_9BACT|nr:pseudouridine synthase [Pontibacter aydingkolensis]MBW7467612.1 pseudouridine synthase [Pontibacter aydingkolensis]